MTLYYVSAPTCRPHGPGCRGGSSSEQGGRQGAKRNLDHGSGGLGASWGFLHNWQAAAGPSSMKTGCKAEIPQSLSFPRLELSCEASSSSLRNPSPHHSTPTWRRQGQAWGLPPAPPHLQLLFRGSPGLDLFIFSLGGPGAWPRQ